MLVSLKLFSHHSCTPQELRRATERAKQDAATAVQAAELNSGQLQIRCKALEDEVQDAKAQASRTKPPLGKLFVMDHI